MKSARGHFYWDTVYMYVCKSVTSVSAPVSSLVNRQSSRVTNRIRIYSSYESSYCLYSSVPSAITSSDHRRHVKADTDVVFYIVIAIFTTALLTIILCLVWFILV